MGRGYIEWVIDGPTGCAAGFLEGYFAARGVGDRVLDAEIEGFDVEPLREAVREMLHPGHERAHLLVPTSQGNLVEEALRAAKDRGLPLEPHARRSIALARFEFTAAAYSKEAGARLRALFEELPAGVFLRPDRPFKERVDPDARATDVYAPAHAYELRGKGLVEGPVEGVIAIFRECAAEGTLRLGKIELVEGCPDATEV
jgi:hypothetical protein